MSQSSDFISINPYTGEKLAEIPCWNTDYLLAEIKKLHQGYLIWSQCTVAERKVRLQAIADALTINLSELAGLITLEVGKPILQSRAEINKSISLINYYIDHLDEFQTGRNIPLGNGRQAKVRYFPKGIILGIMPWNFPVWQALRFAIPVIAGGNVVAVKMAQNTGMTAQKIDDIFQEAFSDFPVYRSIFTSHESVNDILALESVVGVSLTGSERAGVAVGTAAGRTLKKCVLELGGSDSYIVLQDADLALAATTAARARLNNNGQTCIAAKRFIIQQSIADDFIDAFIAAIKTYKIGSPDSESSYLTVLARHDLARTLDEQVNKSLSQGAKILLDGGMNPDLPAAYSPQVLTDIPTNSPAAQEELFGPVASIFVARDENEAIQISNHTRYGLGASLWTTDQDRALRLAAKLEVGSVAVNQQLSSDPRVPFGGIKASGYGREMSMEGYFEFLNAKSIFI